MMRLIRLIRRMRSLIDGFDVFFGFLPGMAFYAAGVSWLNQIVRALRGEAAKEDWRATLSTSAALAAWAMSSATEVRESVALRESVAETGRLLREAAAEAAARDQRMSDLLQRAASDAEERDRRAAARENRLFWVAVLTLLAAIVTLAVSIIASL